MQSRTKKNCKDCINRWKFCVLMWSAGLKSGDFRWRIEWRVDSTKRKLIMKGKKCNHSENSINLKKLNRYSIDWRMRRWSSRGIRLPKLMNLVTNILNLCMTPLQLVSSAVSSRPNRSSKLWKLVSRFRMIKFKHDLPTLTTRRF